ncbi:uncharacterized protein LOC143428931 [Xylocopa sonorina]|uniref:uncharacterized protein LOC143428931 n=1 Tax=Xylocopa sonorina TaxID=1818115 RepID=UPI00403AC3A4
MLLRTKMVDKETLKLRPITTSIRNSKDISEITPKPYVQELNDEIEDIWADRPQEPDIKLIWKEAPQKAITELSRSKPETFEDTWKLNLNQSDNEPDSLKSKLESPLLKSIDEVEGEQKPKLKVTRKKPETDKKKEAKSKSTSRKHDDASKQKETIVRRRPPTKTTEGSKVQGIENTILYTVSKIYHSSLIFLSSILYLLYFFLIHMNTIQDEEPVLDSKREGDISNEPKVYIQDRIACAKDIYFFQITGILRVLTVDCIK